MSQLDCMNSNFDIESIPGFNNVEGLNDISEYLDFAIASTIRREVPNITEVKEKELAATILKNYMDGTNVAFTNKYNIKNNIEKIGIERIKTLLLKTLLEKDSRRLLEKTVPESFAEQCASYVTSSVYYQIDTNEEWIRNNIPTFIDVYVEDSYGKTHEAKVEMAEMCYGNNMIIKALENLDNKMSKDHAKSLVKIA